MFWTHPDVQSDLNAEAAHKAWYTSDKFNRYPSKSKVRASVASVLEGWAPPSPIIHPSTRVLAMGSCFAANFVEWLISHGYNLPLVDNPYSGLLRNAFENVSVVAQQFRWAFGEFDPQTAVWYDKSKKLVEPTEERRLALRAILEQTDVLIVTLGLSEVWYDTQTGEPLWRVLPVGHHDPSRHAFKVETVSDTVRCFQVIDSIRERYLPNLKILYTVSPLRLHATFRPISAVTANSVSKAIIRAALDEFFRSREGLLGETYYYFPSYEIATDVAVDPFADDQHHLHEAVLSYVLELFASHYTSFAHDGKYSDSVLSRVDQRLEHVEKAYDERLKQAAVLAHEVAILRKTRDERLALIHQLDQACKDMRASQLGQEGKNVRKSSSFVSRLIRKLSRKNAA